MFTVILVFAAIAFFVWIVWPEESGQDRRIRESLEQPKTGHPPAPVTPSVFRKQAHRTSANGRNRPRREDKDDEDDEEEFQEKQAPMPDAVPMYYDQSYTTLRSHTPPPVESNHGRGGGRWSGLSIDDSYSRPSSLSSYDSSSSSSSHHSSPSPAPSPSPSPSSSSSSSSWFDSGSSSSSGSSGSCKSSKNDDNDCPDD